MTTFILDKLQPATNTNGPWRLYVYGKTGFHSGARQFAREPRDGELSIADARRLTDEALLGGRQVRVTDGGDMLIFHAFGAKVYHGEGFWESIQ